MKIVKYEPQFAQAFKDLNIEWISKYFRVEEKDLEQLSNPEQCIAEGGEIFLVVDSTNQSDNITNGDNDLVAIGTTAMYNLGDGRYELAKMAVRPDYQGRGLSNLLMKACEDWAHERGAKEILIVSNTSLTPAITLYKKHGYIVTRLGPDPIYERGDIELIKKL